ncbi:extracellular solute-binding protein [Cyanobacterium sp. DS4]|uniref:extracellular solute-binding protein n=1 Tax=Cyanobacterium sp. DS4 TaxID=2878255 RepID=UPI002E802051|nr:extracellular solute-binding protein [Cyanobacterium sp. Dongsha4]WVK99202.1 extracellular solute-binding protein [Cyanobacterium sp. Dongsha4]
MLSRRLFLLGSGSVALSSVLSGCESASDLSIAILEGSLPNQLITNIKQESAKLGIVKLKPESTLEKLYQSLLTQQEKTINKTINNLNNNFQKSTHQLSIIGNNQTEIKKQDLTTLGNYWLPFAIENELIDPLDLKILENWSKLSPLFQKLVTRNNQGKLDNQDQIWGAPYRWGYTMIAYREDKFQNLGWQPQDWGDLWKPEIKHRFSLLNQPREVIGLVLKKLGYSYNTKNLKQITNLLQELQTLNQQVKFYDSRNYLQPLILGDTWLAVGWSTDIIPLIERYHNIKAVIPISGTSLWADIWVKPRSQSSELEKIYNWIDFCWQSKSARQISLFSSGISPVETSFSEINRQIPLISPEVLAKSEFIEPLESQFFAEYEKIWTQL